MPFFTFHIEVISYGIRFSRSEIQAHPVKISPRNLQISGGLKKQHPPPTNLSFMEPPLSRRHRGQGYKEAHGRQCVNTEEDQGSDGEEKKPEDTPDNKAKLPRATSSLYRKACFSCAWVNLVMGCYLYRELDLEIFPSI